MSSKHHKVKVGISVGDFNGIGPEIIMKSLMAAAILMVRRRRSWISIPV